MSSGEGSKEDEQLLAAPITLIEVHAALEKRIGMSLPLASVELPEGSKALNRKGRFDVWCDSVPLFVEVSEP